MVRMFKTKLTHARFSLSPLSSEAMAGIGEVVLRQKIDRIKRAIDSNDNPAKPLKEAYARRKQLRNRAGIRDWTFSGQMLGSLKVKAANQNRFVIGFVNDRADDKATIQRRKCEMLSNSPSDEKVWHDAVRDALIEQRVVRLQINGSGTGVQEVA